MAKREYNGECLVRCKSCGAVNTAVWSTAFFRKSWTIKNCSKCNSKIDTKELKTVLCPHCGKLVEKDQKDLCLNCGKLIYREDEAFPVQCDNCGVENLIPLKHDGTVFCAVCGEKLPDAKLKPSISASKLPAQNIRLKDQHAMLNEDLVIWKHPLSQFSAQSRLQVNEGTWALLLQNGVCQYPYGPGSYLLEDTDMGQQAKLAAAATGEDVILNTDIFCVVKSLPEIKWGTGANRIIIQEASIQNRNEARDYQIKANGEIIWNISDPKAFAERFGFRELHGSELTFTSDSEDAALVKETRKAVHDALYNSARIVIGQENLHPMKLEYYQLQLERQLKIELDRIMDGIGLVCGVMKVTNFKVEEIVDSAATAETKRRDTIRKAARKEYRWTATDVKLYPGMNRNAYASFNFGGIARLMIDEEERLFDASEIQTLTDNAKEAEDFFQNTLNDAVKAGIAPAAQIMIVENRVQIPELYLHTVSLAEGLKGRIQDRFSSFGMGIESIHFDPPVYTESQELKRSNEMEERKQKLIRYVENTIKWEIPSISVHMQTNDQMSASDRVKNMGLTAEVFFSGESKLRVTDEELFLRNSEIRGFLESEPFVDEKTVNSFYVEKIRGHFSAKLAGVTQNMINSHGWDIRELNRYTELLKIPAIETLNNLISDWGMRVESTYLHITKEVQSQALLYLAQKESDSAEDLINLDDRKVRNSSIVSAAKSDSDMQKEIDNITVEEYANKQENVIRRMDANERVRDRESDWEINDIIRKSKVDDATHQAQMKALENATEEDVQKVQGSASVDEAKDKMAAEKTERTYRDEIRKQEHAQELAKEALYAKHRLEEAEEEHQRTVEAIRHEAGLDDAKFKETLNGIMHRIDASDLDWQRKLDEYARLARQLGVQDAEDARRAAAKTTEEIKLLQGKTDTEIDAMKAASQHETGMKNVQLNKAQAELQETIDRFAEERDERIKAADFARQEHKDALAFQQNLEDRKQKAEESLTELKEKYEESQREREYKLQLEKMEKEIEKLKAELDAEKTRIQEEVSLGKTQSDNEAKEKEAEYKYLAEKEADRQKRDDELMKRAEALFLYVQNLEAAMDLSRMDLLKHTDDNETKVRQDYANVEKARVTGMDKQQREEIIQKLDDLEKKVTNNDNKVEKHKENEYSNLLKKVNDIIEEMKKNQKNLDDLSNQINGIANSKNCWQCGSVVPKDTRFCSNCGASLVSPPFKETRAKRTSNGVVCPFCDTINEPGAKKCVVCQHDLW